MKVIFLCNAISGAINIIEEYTVDVKTKSAVERQIGIKGETVKRIKHVDY